MEAKQIAPIRLALWLVCALGLAFAFTYWPASSLHGTDWLNVVEDDSFYYFVLARNLAGHGLSTFDGMTLTNGYQPLWQLVLTVQAAIWRDSFSATVLVESAALVGAAFLVFRTIDVDAFWYLPLLSVVLVVLVGYPLVLTGMETSLLFFTFAAFVLALKQAERPNAGWHGLAITAGLVIGARLDAAFFVVAALLIVPRRTQGLRALAFVAVVGLIYMTANKIVFDSWVPISGTVKSLGGLGLNHAMFRQLAELVESGESLPKTIVEFFRALPERALLLAGLTPALMLMAPGRNSFARRVALAMVLGFLPYVLRLVFFSSWGLWVWYGFPVFFLLVADFLLIVDVLQAPSGRRRDRLAVGVVIGVLLGAGVLFTWRVTAIFIVLYGLIEGLTGATRHPARVRQVSMAVLGMTFLLGSLHATTQLEPRLTTSFGATGRMLAARIHDTIGDVKVAMGDRAGGFAYFYAGSVTQLEGLMNDVPYLERVKAHQPIDRILCDRGVRYLVSWEKDLGNYTTYLYPAFRPHLTTFEGPTINVSKADEVARFSDVRDGHSAAQIQEYAYLWRLPSCGGRR